MADFGFESPPIAAVFRQFEPIDLLSPLVHAQDLLFWLSPMTYPTESAKISNHQIWMYSQSAKISNQQNNAQRNTN